MPRNTRQAGVNCAFHIPCQEQTGGPFKARSQGPSAMRCPYGNDRLLPWTGQDGPQEAGIASIPVGFSAEFDAGDLIARTAQRLDQPVQMVAAAGLAFDFGHQSLGRQICEDPVV